MKSFNEFMAESAGRSTSFERRLEEGMKCWKGYKKVGTKIGKSGKRVNDCEKK